MLTKLRASVAALAFGFLSAPVLAQDNMVSVSVPHARSIAVNALQTNRPDIAIQIAQGLLERDPKDPFAYYVLASAYQQQRAYTPGRKAAVRAFRYAPEKTDKFKSAQKAARLAFDEEKPLLAQYWLRRSLDLAPSEHHRKQVIQDFRVVRAISPWSAQLRFSVVPSSNVNNGSEDTYLIIDGVPVIGVLSGDAQALSGLVGTVDLSASYRLRASKKSETRLIGRTYLRQVALSDDARDLAPNVSNGDFSSTNLELGLRHTLRHGQTKGSSAFELLLGQSWYGGKQYGQSVSAAYSRSLIIGSQQLLTLSVSGEYQKPKGENRRTSRIYEARGVYTRQTKNGNQLKFGAILALTESANGNSAGRSTTGYVQYSFANPIGPARVSLNFGVSHKHLSDYAVGFSRVPGGRKDESAFANIDLIFDDYGYAGFAPTLTIRGRKTWSNVSRFDTKELALSLGFRSSF